MLFTEEADPVRAFPREDDGFAMMSRLSLGRGRRAGSRGGVCSLSRLLLLLLRFHALQYSVRNVPGLPLLLVRHNLTCSIQQTSLFGRQGAVGLQAVGPLRVRALNGAVNEDLSFLG